MKRFSSKIISFLMIIVLCFSFAGCDLFKSNTFVPEFPDSSAAAQSYNLNVNQNAVRVSDRVSAIAKVQRSVVAIEMEYETTSGSTSSSYGSGVIVDNADPNDNIFYVLTCFHVIDSKGDITVYVPDMNTRNYTDDDYDENFAFKGTITNSIRSDEITLIGGDKLSDVAVLKLDVTGSGVSKNQIVSSVIPAANYNIALGEGVFSIGNPSGELPMTVSDGIISYIDRKAEISEIGEMLLTQIDVQINHGNSGGGLFNYYGELVGITNAGSETYEGINYAIPYKHLTQSKGGFVDIATQLIATYYDTFDQKNFGYVTGSWEIGITIKAYSQMNTTPVIVSVVEGSNADGKLRENDIIKGVSCSKLSYQQAVSSVDGFANALCYLRSRLRLGDSFALQIVRSNTEMSVTIELTEQMIFCDTGYRAA